MERDGTWGTEQEITAAANLFCVSLTAYNKCSCNKYANK